MTAARELHGRLTGQHLRFLQTGRDTAGALLQVEVRLDPGGHVPRHVHGRQDERVEVLAGTLSMRVGRSERVLRAGDVADVPRRKVHVVRNAGEGEALFLLEVRPARRMEKSMRAVFAVSNALAPLRGRRRAVHRRGGSGA